ncbi:bifunctional non-homologous end joining protein LigD [Formivibrio citricus]|uniref:Bifunctional non-homologous end joining protein LigD n=1 Tax=Formivibrio citricus TaxID=83765 RepID=A0A1I4Z541_9NEIS|nr:RNA ligase family protein [Formivibrio citricus]SFN45404.1 bifunctional non-homologous end joining protein LigD [Formivibrio citricus]
MKIHAQAHLFLTDGRSNKEYHIELGEVADGFVVNFRFGRRGGTLTSGTKTVLPVDLEQARKIYNKLLQEKTSKGYTPEASGTPYQATTLAERQTGFVPQLLNPVSEQEAMNYLVHPLWAAQEKMDGERRAAHTRNGKVIGANRKGLQVPLPQSLAHELQAIAVQHGEIHVDGELIGEQLHVFDLHVHRGRSVHALPWLERMRLAEVTLAGCRHLKTVAVATGAADKQRLWQQVKTARGEGIVFKRVDCPVTEGRPNSGGDWLKFKFTESASCCVVAINPGKRSVRLGVFELNAKGRHLISVGNVTIPPNHAIPASGDIVEVEYLYAYPGGSLFQPVYRGKRSDLDSAACTVQQLKFKPESSENEDV